METIKEILGGVVRTIEQQCQAKDDVEVLWRQAVRTRLSRHTKVHRFKGTFLYIRVENPVWLYAVRTQQGRIEKRLSTLSHNKIKHIRASVGDIHGQR